MAARKPTSSKSAEKTPAKQVTKTAAKTTATRKTANRKTANKKTPAKKSSTKKTSAKKTSTQKTATKKTSAKKTSAHKTSAKKSSAKKTPAKKRSSKTPTRRTPAEQAPPPPPQRLAADERARLQALLAEADPALALADEEAAHAGGDEQRERYADDSWTMGTMWSAPLWSACGEFVAHLEQLAETPARRTSDFTGIEVASVFFVDTRDPGTLLFAPNPEMPAVLFVPIPADVASIRAVLAEYAGTRERSVELRAWMGFGSMLRIPNVYSGQLGPVDDHELDRFFVFSPVASTLSRRTYFSNSKFSYEMHGDDLFLWDLAYAPCTTSPPAVARFKQITGYDFPPDMPVDLVAAVEGFEFATVAELTGRLTLEPQFTPALLAILAALGWRNLATANQLRQHLLRDPDTQATLVNAGFRYGWERLVWDVLRVAIDGKMQGQIAGALADIKLPTLPAPTGARHILPPGAELPAFLAHATARGWTPQTIADDDRHTRAAYTLPGHTDATPRRISWVDVPALELSTLALERADDELPALALAYPGSPADDPWRVAATDAWLGREAPLLAHLTAALTSSAWPDRQAAARMIGVTRLAAAKDLVTAALASEPHAATRKTLEATFKILDPDAELPQRTKRK